MFERMKKISIALGHENVSETYRQAEGDYIRARRPKISTGSAS